MLSAVRRFLAAHLRPVLLLGLAMVLAFALSAHPSTSVPPNAEPQLRSLDSSVIGPHCPIGAYATVDGDPGIWVLPPQRQVLPYELIEAGYPDTPVRSHDLVARVTCTAYSSTPDQTDSTPFITASMQRVERGIIALSRDLLRRYTPGAPFDFGDHVELVGVGVFRVEDTMHRRWRNRADIWVHSKAEARQWGRRALLIGALRNDDVVEILDRSPVWIDEQPLEVELRTPDSDSPGQV